MPYTSLTRQQFETDVDGASHLAWLKCILDERDLDAWKLDLVTDNL